MKFVNTKKLENSNGNSAVNVKENSTQNAKSNLDKRFEALGKIGNKSLLENKKQIVSLSLDSNVIDSLNDYCKKHCSSKSAIVNRAIAEWLEKN